MKRSLSSLCSSSPHYPLWQGSALHFNSLSLSRNLSPFRSPHTNIPSSSFSLQQHNHFFLQMTAPEVNWKGEGLLTLSDHSGSVCRATSASLFPPQARYPRGCKAQSHSIPTWIKYAHCQHFLQQPGTLFIFARHRAE